MNPFFLLIARQRAEQARGRASRPASGPSPEAAPRRKARAKRATA